MSVTHGRCASAWPLRTPADELSVVLGHLAERSGCAQHDVENAAEEFARLLGEARAMWAASQRRLRAIESTAKSTSER